MEKTPDAAPTPEPPYWVRTSAAGDDCRADESVAVRGVSRAVRGPGAAGQIHLVQLAPPARPPHPGELGEHLDRLPHRRQIGPQVLVGPGPDVDAQAALAAPQGVEVLLQKQVEFIEQLDGAVEVETEVDARLGLGGRPVLLPPLSVLVSRRLRGLRGHGDVLRAQDGVVTTAVGSAAAGPAGGFALRNRCM